MQKQNVLASVSSERADRLKLASEAQRKQEIIDLSCTFIKKHRLNVLTASRMHLDWIKAVNLYSLYNVEHPEEMDGLQLKNKLFSNFNLSFLWLFLKKN